ncbi:MAG TPA: winged helix-turn-helix domain-containing protein [bacterium]|nr:winged helix-turn-helix domain-containing protein [bacterium]
MKDDSSLFFIYEQQLEQLAQAQQMTYLYGGRGVGKSTFLRRLEQRLGPQDVIWIEGDDWFAARQRLAEIDPGDLKLSKHLIIDDLDRFCAVGYDREGDKFEEMINRLDELFKRLTAPDRQKRVYAAGTRKPQFFINGRDRKPESAQRSPWWQLFWSYIDMSWNHVLFNPWELGWKQNLSDWIEKRFAVAVQEPVWRLWAKLTISLTGGHPSLIKAALAGLEHLARGEELTPVEKKLRSPFDVNESDERWLQTRHYLEDCLVQTGLNRLRRALQSLWTISQSSRPEVAGFLTRLAQDEPIIPPYDVREILIDHSVIYLDAESGSYQIPGDLLKNEILHLFPPSEDKAQITVQPDTAAPQRRGTMVLQVGQTPMPIRLNGSTWRLLSLLHQQGGQVVSLDTLQKKLNKTEYGVRSALQRLENKLKEVGADHLLENQRGKGYRFRSE